MDAGSRPPLKLSPELALGYLRELSCDHLAGCVLAADGTPLVGTPVPLGAASALARALAGDGRLEADGRRRRLYAAAGGGHVVVVSTGPLSLPGLVRHDLDAVLAALAGAALDRRPAGDITLAAGFEDSARAPRGASDAELRGACVVLLDVLAPP